jgi:hypothetical protein
MFRHLQNAFNGSNAAFYDRFRVPHQALLTRLGALPPPRNDTVVYLLAHMQQYLTGTLALLMTLFFGHRQMKPIFNRETLLKMSPANGERLFCLLLIGLIRQSTVSEHTEGDSFSDLAALLIPDNVLPAARRLSAALRISDMPGCERKLHDVLEQLLSPLDVLTRMLISSYVLPICATLNSERRATLQALNLA